MPPRAPVVVPQLGAIARLIAADVAGEGQAFPLVFKDAALTRVQLVKQWINVVVYSCGKAVARTPRNTESNLEMLMNKAYYLRLQVIFADVEARTSYWSRHFGFDCTFAQMMTYTFGASGGAASTPFFDYNENERLDASQVEGLFRNWTTPFLWKKYNEIKSEMINQMLPVLLKQRIRSKNSGELYEFYSGGSLAEVTWATLGALFQVRWSSYCAVCW
jgi:hypothetical protein